MTLTDGDLPIVIVMAIAATAGAVYAMLPARGILHGIAIAIAAWAITVGLLYLTLWLVH